MSNAKKFLIIVFTVMLVISLRFNTSLTHKMDNGFSLTQLVENIFVPEVYATFGGYGCKAKSGCGHVECTGTDTCEANDHSVTCDGKTSTCFCYH
ncbi:hypothetical protein [Caldithrix abyssi]|uniref:hypothetical protein n=1 Tax=Caldithrix abyssi TaxID=187145 RepID=UPI0012373EA1|nr:hypothetical protein [Caldithrix abyssi]